MTTYESISRFALPQDFGFDMLIADEAHYVKNPGARRTQALLILQRKALRKKRRRKKNMFHSQCRSSFSDPKIPCCSCH